MRYRGTLLIGLLLCWAGGAAAQFAPFRTAAIGLNSGRVPAGVVIGDFDGDGTSDAITADTNTSSVTVFVQFDGEVFSDRRFPVGSVPTALVAGQFTADSERDLVVGSANAGTVVCLRGKGDGSFEAPGAPLLLSGGPRDLATADFNSDGRLDVAVALQGASDNVPGSVVVLLGAGDCTFSQAVELPAEAGTIGVAAGPVDAGDLADIVAVNSRANSVSVFLNSGSGAAFTLAGTFSVGLEPQAVALGDLDGDGWADVVTADKNSNGISVLAGDGTGQLAAPTAYRGGTAPSDVTIGDLNGDDVADVVCANNLSGDVSVFLGDGAGALRAARNFVADGQPAQVVLGLFDGDDLMDVITANVVGGDGSVAVLAGRGAGVLHAVEDVSVGNGPAAVAVGDLDGDALPDAVVVHEGGDVVVLSGQSTGGLRVVQTLPVDGQTRGVVTADFDGDGELDAAAADHANNRILVFLGNGDGTLRSQRELATAGAPAGIAAGDFDGNGTRDLAVSTFADSGAVVMYPGNGDGSFSTPCTTAVGEAPVAIGVGDLNADGRDDLVVVNEGSNTVSVLLNGGGCSFNAAAPLLASGPRAVVVAHIDGDRFLDVAVGDSVVSPTQPVSVLLFLGNGDGTFRAGFPVRGSRVDAMVARDFSGDGVIDLALADQTSNVVRVLHGRGDGRFSFLAEVAVSRMPVALAAADFDGDGRYDVVTTNSQVTANNLSHLVNCSGDTHCSDADGEPALRGDANDDTRVSAADLTALAREVADGTEAVEDVAGGGFAAGLGADADGDGLVAPRDARATVVRLFAGGIAS